MNIEMKNIYSWANANKLSLTGSGACRINLNYTIFSYCFITASDSNLARNKQTIQSSDWSSGLASFKAVDGNLDTYSCTRKERNNYWSVDLGMDANIDYLYIKNIYALTGGELTFLPTSVGIRSIQL